MWKFIGNLAKWSNSVYTFCCEDKQEVLKSKDLMFLLVVRKKMVPCIQVLKQHGKGEEGRLPFCIGHPLDRCLHVRQLSVQLYAINQGTTPMQEGFYRTLTWTLQWEKPLLQMWKSWRTLDTSPQHIYHLRKFSIHISRPFICAAVNSRRLAATWSYSIKNRGVTLQLQLLQMVYNVWTELWR